MSHVSKEALALWWQWLDEEHVEPERLTDGTPWTPETLQAAARVPWDDFTVLLERFCELVGGQRALVEVMRCFLETRREDPLAALYRSVAHPKLIYRAVNQYVGPMLFTIVEPTLEDVDDDHVRVTLRIPEPYRDCPAWFWACKGTLAQLPTLVDWPRARVSLEVQPRLGVYDVELRRPPRRRLRLREWFPRRNLDDATAALASHQADLRRSYRALAEATHRLEVQADREQRLARIGRQLSEHVELRPLLDAICSVCVEELGFSGTVLEVPFEGEVRTARRGAPDGERHVMKLERSAALGTLTVWAEPDHDAFGLFPGILRWIALAVENALRFEAQVVTNAALEASEARWRALVQSLPDVVLTLDPSRRITWINQARFGLDRSAVVGQSATTFAAPGSTLAAALDRVFGGETVDGENAWTGPDGVARHLSWRMGPVWREGEVSSAVFVVRDETERRRADEERRELEHRVLEAQKLDSLGVLAGGIAHDFNNLLMGITANAELAALQLPDDHPARRFVDRIENAGTRAGELTRQMLAYAGRRAVRPEPVDLTRLVGELTDLLRAAVPKHVALVTDLALDLPPVEADPAQVQQVVMNVLTNAADAVGEAGGTVTIRTERCLPGPDDLRGNVLAEQPGPGEHAVIEVRDTGAGMDPVTRRRIFDPFFSTKAPGRGLGLAAVLGIVRAHRGALVVHSSPGGGTTFRVLFPTSGRAEPTARRRPSSADQRLAGRAVLVVDDEAIVRQVACDLLTHHGAEVVPACDGDEALRIFEARRDFDLVLLDLTMPGPPGDQVFDRLRALRADTRVVLTSGYDARDAVRALQHKGLVGFLRKPFDGRQLVDVVEQAVNQA